MQTLGWNIDVWRRRGRIVCAQAQNLFMNRETQNEGALPPNTICVEKSEDNWGNSKSVDRCPGMMMERQGLFTLLLTLILDAQSARVTPWWLGGRLFSLVPRWLRLHHDMTALRGG